MTPQSSFMVLAPLQKSRIGAMRELLATMNFEPGLVNPENSLIPFARFEQLHFARLVVLDDQTTEDITELYGVKRPTPPVYLAFLGDIDGSYDDFIRELVQRAAPGLREIFSLCDGFSAAVDLSTWLVDHERRPATYYCNWIGRTVRQTHEEEQLRRSLVTFIEQSDLRDRPPRAVHQALRTYVDKEKAAGRIKLTPPDSTPLGWTVRHILDWTALVLVIVVGIVTLPVTIIPLAILAWRLRSLENSDPVKAPRPDRWGAALAVLEDHDVTNQFSVMGALKPGWLRSFLVAVILRAIDLAARTLYGKGRLARVHTIHFARWVYLDNGTRLFFASNYDGSLESYMDDFINKVGFGLNVVFSNGVSYPHTDWLLLKGAKDEQTFKYVLRRHQLATEVWYNGHAGLTAHNLECNSAIRQGLEAASLSEAAAREWVALL